MVNDKQVYHFGIIDYLQDFNWKKELEWKFKHKFSGAEKFAMSSIPSEHYQKRFFDFMRTKVFVKMHN